MMSAAFQVFMTASMSSYLTPSRVLLGLKGSPVLRHFTHGSLNMLAPRHRVDQSVGHLIDVDFRCCSSPSAAI